MIWATWIFDRYERVKESLTYTLYVLFTQACDASNGDYFLSNGKRNFVFKNLFRTVPDPDLEMMGTWSSRLLDNGGGRDLDSKKVFVQDFWASVWSENRGGPGPPGSTTTGGQICFWKGREVMWLVACVEHIN